MYVCMFYLFDTLSLCCNCRMKEYAVALEFIIKIIQVGLEKTDLKVINWARLSPPPRCMCTNLFV
jgi:hypothetical protein